MDPLFDGPSRRYFQGAQEDVIFGGTDADAIWGGPDHDLILGRPRPVDRDLHNQRVQSTFITDDTGTGE